MKVVQSCLGKFHHFHLARELHRRDALECIFTGYPWFKLKGEGIPRDKVRSFPWLQGLRMGGGRFGLRSEILLHELEQWSHRAHDRFTCRNLPSCDAFVGLSGTAVATGQRAKREGALYICDRGSTHIRTQSRLMREEAVMRGLTSGIGELVDARTVVREESEYQTADFITVPSEYTRRSFIAEGVAPEKVVKIPYGADVTRFRREGEPPPDTFTVLFVGQLSFRKGILYLIDAFNSLPIRQKRLILVGIASPALEPFLRERRLDQVTLAGPVAHGELSRYYSRAHVLALPSIEEGLAYVMGEAMACGCPVIATENTGAEDLLDDGQSGFIVAARRPDLRAERLQRIWDDAPLRERMSAAASARTQAIGGWGAYGEKFHGFLRQQLELRK